MAGAFADETSKGGVVEHHHASTGVDAANAAAVYEKDGNQYDEMDMDRMGKLQELRVSIDRLSIRMSQLHNSLVY